MQRLVSGDWEKRVLKWIGKDSWKQRAPSTVFDPFVGSGTTVQVALSLGRCGIGADLSEDYLHLAQKRIEKEIT